MTFIESYSYTQPFEGNREADVAPGENEFDTPGLEPTLELSDLEDTKILFVCFLKYKMNTIVKGAESTNPVLSNLDFLSRKHTKILPC